MTQDAMTRRQKQIFDIIKDGVEANGWCPTIREIGTASGIRSPNGVRCHLLALAKKGWIETGADGASRCIRIAGHRLRHVKLNTTLPRPS